MWRDRRLLDLLQIEFPIIQAPMAGAVSPLDGLDGGMHGHAEGCASFTHVRKP
jgi:hypothetical protein